MDLKYGLVSVDDHVQEHPEVWTQRLSSSKWGDRIPHVEQTSDGTEYWVGTLSVTLHRIKLSSKKHQLLHGTRQRTPKAS